MKIVQDSISQQVSSAEGELGIVADLEGIRDLQQIELLSTGRVRKTLTAVRERLQTVCCSGSLNPHTSVIMLTVSTAFVIVPPYSNKALATGCDVSSVLGVASYFPYLRLCGYAT